MCQTTVKMLILLAGLHSMTGCSGNEAPNTSQPSTISGPSDIKLMTEADAAATQATVAVGNIMLVLQDVANPAQNFAYPKCTGIQIGPHHVLTASHCHDARLVFSKKQIALNTAPETLTFNRFGETLRLFYDGEKIAAADQAKDLQPMGDAAYINTDWDFAIYYSAANLGEGFVDLFKAEEQTGELALALYGHPHSIPLSKAENCKGALDTATLDFFHDCDSLNGASGGLIVETAGGAPLAMHLSGPFNNSAGYYEEHGEFETLSAQKNRALLLSTIAAIIQEEAPALAAELAPQEGCR